jgi:hypothetical protein
MDLTLPLVAVLGVIGYNLNAPMNTREYTNKRVKIPESELNSSKTIYQAREFARIEKQERERVEKIRANNTLVSFNSATDAMPTKIPNKKMESQNDYTAPKEPSSKIFTGPMFTPEKYWVPEDNVKDFNSKETFTGNVGDFNHQNMQPFFGSKVRQANTSDVLGRYTGRDLGEGKKEIEGTVNGPVDSVNGNVLFTDKIQQDRFIGSTFQTGLLPFVQTRVQPIPDIYNRGSQKTIDELNVNTKTVLEGRFTPGNTISKREILGEVLPVRRDNFHELGRDRQFITSGIDNKGYFEDTDFNRDTRKPITAEATLNQQAGIDFKSGSIMRAGRTDTGNNTIVQEDKRGNFASNGNWVRSRRATETIIQTGKNLSLRGQQRPDTNRPSNGNVSGIKNGEVNRYTDALKTTNKELSLYTYKGGSSGSAIKKPENRDAWYNNATKTKVTSEFTPAGKKIGAPGAGVDTVKNFTSKKLVAVENRLGAGASQVQPGVTAIGFVSRNKIETSDNDRIHVPEYKKSYDRPLGKLT